MHSIHNLTNGAIDFYPSFLMPTAADTLLAHLVTNPLQITWGTLKAQPDFVPAPHFFSNTNWQQHQVFVYGKWHPTPRLTAWQSTAGQSYGYAGLQHPAEPMTAALLAIKIKLENLTNAPFNSVLLNWYRSGADAMGWHADNEPELGKNPVIASLSLGATRQFVLKHNQLPQKEYFDLHHGSLLVMRGATQHHWKHALPRSKKVLEGRINLTFRHIQQSL